MKQIFQSLKTGEITLQELPVPVTKPGCLLIKTARSLISLGTERMLVDFGRASWLDKARQQPDKVKQAISKIKTDGLMPTYNAISKKLEQPMPLGYSSAGTVLDVGAGVKGYSVGDRVACNGNHAEVVCINQNLCAKIPESLDFSSASFTVVSSIALQGVRLVEPTIGESIAIIGLGLIGLITAQILVANGCRVIGFDFDQSRLDLAEEFGISTCNISKDVDPIRVANDFSGGYGVDAVIITASTSSNDPISQAPQMCRKRGRVVLVGVSGLNLSRDDFYKKEISFQVSCSYGPGRYEQAYEQQSLDYPIGFVRWTEQRNFSTVLNLISEKKLNVEKLISKEIDINNALEAYELVSANSGVLGLVLKYQDETVALDRTISISQPQFCSDPKKAVLGFVGAGSYASGVLIPAFAKTGAAFKTIASSTGVSGTFVGKKYSFASSTTDPDILFNDSQINTVVITTQHDSHAKYVIEALNNRKNVFVEKPLCMSFEQLDAIKEAWEKANSQEQVRLMVGFNRRFSLLVTKCQELLREQKSPIAIIITVNAGALPPEHWTNDSDTGGGRILGEACHFIDLMRYLTRSAINSCNTNYMATNLSLNDTATINMSFENGSIGSIHYFSNGNKDFPKERIEIFSAGNIYQIDNFKSLKVFGSAKASTSLWTQDKGQNACAQAFIDSIQEGLDSPIPFDQIYEVARYSLLTSHSK